MGAMTMYLPNDDLRPVGAEVDEFVDVPPVRRDVTLQDDADDSPGADDSPSA